MAIQIMVPISPRPCHGERHCLAHAGRVISRPGRSSLSPPIEAESSSSQAHPWMAMPARDRGSVSLVEWRIERADSDGPPSCDEVAGLGGRSGVVFLPVGRPGLGPGRAR